MPAVESIQIKLSDQEGHATTAPAECKHFSPLDARTNAMKWAGGCFLVALCMLPIPLVHFAVPLVLLMSPLVYFVVKKVYSGGDDVRAKATCPHCNAPLDLMLSGTEWPMHRVCMSCRQSYMVERLDMPAGATASAPA
jgi:hypothetical protein